MINQFRYKQKQFWLEYALIAVQLLPYLFEAGTLEVSLCAFALALIKFRVEGLRINAALFVLTYLCYLLWGIGIVHLLLLLALLCFTLKLRVYNIPSTRQSIGYRRIRLDKAEIELFYPTNATEGRNDKRLFPEGVWNTMYNIVNKDTEHQSKLPWWVIYLTCHYYTRMLMPNTYPNVRPAAGCFPIMILSHQLGLNSLYSFAREFVDEGYFVISLIHRESIRNPFPGLEPNRLHRIEQLKERVQDVKRALDFAQDHKRFAKVMGEDLTLDFSRVNTYGHSFGASTCISAAMQDNRINGLVIAMDPCMYLFRDEDTIHPEKLNYNTKTLVILAEDYYETHYPSFQNDYRINVFRQNAKPAAIMGYRFIGANHGSFSEMALIAEGQFRMFNVLRNNPDTFLFLELSISMIKALIHNPKITTQEELLDIVIKQNPQLRSSIVRVARSLNHAEEVQRHRLCCEKRKPVR